MKVSILLLRLHGLGVVKNGLLGLRPDEAESPCTEQEEYP
jgi:hypothetical protein